MGLAQDRMEQVWEDGGHFRNLAVLDLELKACGIKLTRENASKERPGWDPNEFHFFALLVKIPVDSLGMKESAHVFRQ
jgi:hypothetical protein